VSSDLGVCLAAFADRGLDDALGHAARLGLRSIDLPTDSVFALAAGVVGGDGGEGLKAMLDRHGIAVACVSNSRDTQLLLGPHGPHTDGISPGDAAAKRAHGERAALASIRAAATLGAPLVRIMPGCPDHSRWLRWPRSDVSWADNVDAAVEVLTPLAIEAGRLGVRLCIEPHVKQVAYDAPSTVEVLRGVRAGGGDVGVCFDAANLAAIHHDPVAVLDALGEVPACVHVKDVEVSSGGVAPEGPGWVAYGPHPPVRFRVLGWGRVDWPAVLARLTTLGYAGPLLIEHEDVLVEPVQGVAVARDRLSDMVATGAGPGVPWW
jgi:sugar phosphate isomerase/epimerase